MLTRRQFVGSTIAASASLAAPLGAQAQTKKKRIVVDAQVHMWKASAPDYPWNPGAKPQLPQPFTVARALPMMDAIGIDRVVIVPPGLNDVNAYALSVAKRYPKRFAVMGRIPLQDKKSMALLPNWKKQPGMLGVRLTFLRKAATWVDDGTADWFWPAAEKAGLPVMFLAWGQTNKFEKIAARHPGLPLIIDHMGVNQAVAKAGKTAEVIGYAVAMAKYPNVSVKLSNLPNASLQPYPFKDLTPHIKRLYDAFGPQRCHWGTDTTNGMARVDWKQRFTHVSETLTFLSEQDKDWIMGRSIMQKLKWA